MALLGSVRKKFFNENGGSFSRECVESPSINWGIDIIDLHALHEHNIRLGWQVGVSKHAVSELVLAFMLNLLRNIQRNRLFNFFKLFLWALVISLLRNYVISFQYYK